MVLTLTVLCRIRKSRSILSLKRSLVSIRVGRIPRILSTNKNINIENNWQTKKNKYRELYRAHRAWCSCNAIARFRLVTLFQRQRFRNLKRSMLKKTNIIYTVRWMCWMLNAFSLKPEPMFEYSVDLLSFPCRINPMYMNICFLFLSLWQALMLTTIPYWLGALVI